MCSVECDDRLRATQLRSKYLSEIIERGALKTESLYWKVDELVMVRRANNLLSLVLELMALGVQAPARQALSFLVSVFRENVGHVPGLLMDYSDIETNWEHSRVWGDVSDFYTGCVLLDVYDGATPNRELLGEAASLDMRLLERGAGLEEERQGLSRCNVAIKSWSCQHFPKCLLCNQEKHICEFYDRHFAWPIDRRETTLPNQMIKICYLLALGRDCCCGEFDVTCRLIQTWNKGFLTSLTTDANKPADAVLFFLLAYSAGTVCGSSEGGKGSDRLRELLRCWTL